MKKIAIIGASNDRTKYGNKAVRAYKKAGWEVIPINPKEKEIEGIKAYKNIKEYPGTIEKASLYVRPEIGITIIKDLKEKGVKEIILNPGAESPELIKKITEEGMTPELICSIRMIGEDPELL